MPRALTARRAFLRSAGGTCALALFGPALHAEPAAAGTGAARLPDRRAGVLLSGCRQDDNLWVGDHRGQLFRSPDGGASWQRSADTAPGGITAIVMAGRRGLAVGHRGSVLASTDGGLRWQPRHIAAPESLSLLDAAVLPQDRLLAVGAFGACWASDDGGARWAAVKAVDDDRHLNACAATAAAIVVVGERGLILRSTDAGRSWAEVGGAASASLFAVAAAGEREFVAAGLGGTLLHSADAGLHWQPLAPASPAAWYGATLVGQGPGRRLLLAGNGGAVASLAPDAAAGWRLQHQQRVGPGAWRTVLPGGSSRSLLAVGENGIQPLPRGPWLA